MYSGCQYSMADDQQQGDKAILADFVKVAIACDNGESQELTKIWRFRKSYSLDYTLSEVEEGIFLK